MTDRLPHDELRLLLGAYVLGGLDSADRRRLDAHLADCAACRAELSQFATVPPLLQLAPPSLAEPGPAPDSLHRLIEAAQARRAAARRRRRWLLAAAAVVLLAAVGGGILALTVRDSDPPPTAVFAVFNGNRVGDAVLVPRDWGTEVRLDVDYPPRGRQPYTAWAIARDGHQEQAATWTTPENGHCVVTGATSIPRDQLDRVEVRTADGRTVLRTG
ncbi:MAG TPA: zf-HC2 domain-containing protein [Pseudonocardiaceae bacterium]|jgi:anti-sigma factor RsiW